MTVRWLLAGLTGLGVALVVSLAAWAFSPVAPLVSAAVFGACALPPGLSFGWLLCVAPITTAQEQRTDDDIETQWLTKALSGTATDLVVVIGLALTAVSITRADVSPSLLLIGLLLVAAASSTMRYALQRHRALAA